MGDHFRFVDDLRTRHTTLRDLLAHRTGLPAYNMALMVGLDPTRSRLDYCRYMALMVGLDPTRSRLDYCRYMALMVGLDPTRSRLDYCRRTTWR